MKIFGLVSLVIAASASFAAADKLAKFEGDLTAIALLLSQRTPQPAVWIGAQYLQDWNNAFALMIEMSGAFGTLGDEMAGVSGSIMTNVFSNAHNLLEAMNVAFASATSEIAASEMGGGSFAQKRVAIAEAFSLAFMQTGTTVNTYFVNEVAELVSMYSQSNSSPSGYGQSLHDKLETLKSAYEPPCALLSYDANTNSACNTFMNSVDAAAAAAALNG